MFQIPNTKELREKYKTQKNSSGDRESARARVSGIYDVENGFRRWKFKCYYFR